MYYSCKGVRKGRRGELVASVILTLGVLLVALSIVYTDVGRILFGCATCVLLLGAMLLARYCFTEYTYMLEGDTLTLTERRGRRIRITSRLRIADIHTTSFVKRSGFKSPRGDVKVYDYRPELMPTEFAVITVTDPDLCEGRESIVILLSPDEKMLHLLGI